MTRFKYRKNDPISHIVVPGKWRIVQPDVSSNHYLCRPDDELSSKLAELLPHGMLLARGQDIQSPDPNQETLL